MKRKTDHTEVQVLAVPYCEKKRSCCEFDAGCLASYKVLSNGSTVYEGCGCKY